MTFDLEEYETYHKGWVAEKYWAIQSGGTLCSCGHDLGRHPPDPHRPFSWPCRVCDCQEYCEELNETSTIYILWEKQDIFTTPYVRVFRGWDGRWVVIEGRTNA